jgi:hypothetical protein
MNIIRVLCRNYSLAFQAGMSKFVINGFIQNPPIWKHAVLARMTGWEAALPTL